MFALRELLHICEVARLGDGGEVGRRATKLNRVASRLLRSSKLTGVKYTPRISERTLESLSTRYGLVATCEFIRAAEQAISLSDRDTIHHIVSDVLLAPREASKIFELQVAFSLIDALKDLGFEELRPRLIPGGRIPLARLKSPLWGDLNVWWQRSPWDLQQRVSVDNSRYRQVLVDSSIGNKQPLRPDLLVERADGHLLLVEVKHTLLDGTRERDGIRDMLAYLDDSHDWLESQPYPHGLVVAWGATGQPALGRVVVSGLEQIRLAAAVVLSQPLMAERGRNVQ